MQVDSKTDVKLNTKYYPRPSHLPLTADHRAAIPPFVSLKASTRKNLVAQDVAIFRRKIAISSKIRKISRLPIAGVPFRKSLLNQFVKKVARQA